MNDDTPLSERFERAPWWTPCVLTFFAGVAIPLAMLMTVNATPDYQRGHADGFAMGLQRGEELAQNERRDLLKVIENLQQQIGK